MVNSRFWSKNHTVLRISDLICVHGLGSCKASPAEQTQTKNLHKTTLSEKPDHLAMAQTLHAIAESSWNAADILVEQVWRWLSKRQGDNYKNGNNQPESAGGKRKVFYLVFLKIIVDGKIKLLTDQRCLSLPSPGPRFDRRPCLDTSHSWK